MTLTEEQAANLRRATTPIANTAARLDTVPITVDLTAIDNHIRDIQARLRSR
ncbi:hypothetical protein [Paenarthrobacter sp. YJN-5]|uniref:hypothetical protein n=1 Tax=Paenarthrobacter sp. YJN-5 TaxID=2735316 RepID=UPI0018780F9C|nr:hypothetical protein [Paenarthrobacter sp. YJN-5]QOT19542.1 hypothetical protein HMI59_23225 [Paenarthrobacter sp. YJN-5]